MSLSSYLIETSIADTAPPLLTPPERRQMLDDIGHIGLTLGRDLYASIEPSIPVSPASNPSVSAASSPMERLALLVQLWPSLQTALCALFTQTDRQARQQTESLPLSRLRGGPSAVTHLARKPCGTAAGQIYGQKTQPFSSWDNEPHLPETRHCHTTDTRANRFVVSLLLAVEQELRPLAVLANFCNEVHAAAQALAVADAARRGRHSGFLRSIGPLAPAERSLLRQGDPALRCAPAYQALFALSRKLFAPLRFDWTDSPLLRLPALEAWHLYEIWCLFQTAAALRSLGWRALEGDFIRFQPEGMRLSLQTGQASRLRFACRTRTERNRASEGQNRWRGFESDSAENSWLDLFYQPLFPSADQTAERAARRRQRSKIFPVMEDAGQIEPPVGRDREREAKENMPPVGLIPGRSTLSGYSSISHAMQPDIALLWKERLYLLDPKFRGYERDTSASDALTEADLYRRNSSLLTDLDKMHAYRDAIRHRGHPAVAEAWCLFPGASAASASLIAYPGGETEESFGSAGIGAIRLRPCVNPELLQRLLKSWLTL